MLNQIQLFFDQYLALPEPTAIAEEKLHLACAALFIEMMHIDDSVQTEEHDMILKRIRDIFSLSTEEATRLINLAEGHRQNATDYHAFTSAASHGERTRGLVVPRRRRSVVLSESER